MNRTSWRWFPAWMIASMAIVFAVNGYMIYDAISTFPGQAGQDGFDLSNAYDNVLAKARQQAELGWQLEADATPVPQLRLTDRSGAAFMPTEINARVERPVGPPETTVLTFHPIEDGTIRADRPLPGGQWDMMLTVRADGRMWSTTRRVIVK